MATYEKAHIDEIASNQWPHWIPVRHHFGIETFGINLWRGQDDGTVIPEHDESGSGAPELYYVVEGQATFTVDGDEVDAPAGTCVWVTDPGVKRAGRASANTLVLSVGAAAPGQAYKPAGWDSHYLEGDK
jgi:quercetin dioxygenase-like cupin family protein